MKPGKVFWKLGEEEHTSEKEWAHGLWGSMRGAVFEASL